MKKKTKSTPAPAVTEIAVPHAAAVALLTNLGFGKAPTMKIEALEKRLGAMAEMKAEQAEWDARAPNLTAEDNALVASLLEAIAAKAPITVTAPAKEAPAKEAPAAKPAKATKPAKAGKSATAKPAKKSGEPRDFSKSNKARVYTAWMKSKKKATVEQLLKVTDGGNGVKETTIKQWVQWWSKGEALPAIATH